jgi:5'-3' exonuclease
VRQLRPNGKNYSPNTVLTNGEGGGDGFGDAAHQNLNTKGLVPYTERDFRDEFLNLDPAQFVDLLAMVGDSSDNIPGVEGIGAKTAPKLLAQYGNIEGAIANAAAQKNKRVRESLGSEKGAATAHLCRSLVKIRTRLNGGGAVQLLKIQLLTHSLKAPSFKA